MWYVFFIISPVYDASEVSENMMIYVLFINQLSIHIDRHSDIYQKRKKIIINLFKNKLI